MPKCDKREEEQRAKDAAAKTLRDERKKKEQQQRRDEKEKKEKEEREREKKRQEAKKTAHNKPSTKESQPDKPDKPDKPAQKQSRLGDAKVMDKDKLAARKEAKSSFQGPSTATLPPALGYKGSWLKGVKPLDDWENSIQALPQAGVTRKTWQDRINALKTMQAAFKEIGDEWMDAPLDEAMAEAAVHLYLQRKWMPQTLHRNMATWTGALNSLKAFTNADIDVNMNLSKTWQQSMRAAEVATKEGDAEVPTAVQKQEVAKAIKKAVDSDRLDLATLLVMTWYTAGRTCDILQLKKENVEVRSDGHLLVTFKRGKTVHARGGWTVHTKLPDEHREILTKYLATVYGKSWVWPFKQRAALTTQVRLALRDVNPALSNRSIRRGSLQTMAANGVSMATLMEYSGHTREATLRRYLGWGKLAQALAKEGTAAAEALMTAAVVQSSSTN